jgi:NTE family protein
MIEVSMAIARAQMRDLLPRPIARSLSLKAERKSLSLALQGGGSFGAFTWGVLQGLLENGHAEFDVISGSSAGAVNAAIVASGLIEGGPEKACERLERFWKRVSRNDLLGLFGRVAVANAADLAVGFVSPYRLNPFGLNPLRDILLDEIDFSRLREQTKIRLLIAATRVRDGRLRLFRRDEISVDVVLASACLPLLHHAVEIEGDWYWDGGYSANPPLRQLVIDTKCEDVLLVQILPEASESKPSRSSDIARRLNQIAFTGPLQKDVEALQDLMEISRKQGIFGTRFGRKLQRLRLHRISAEDSVADLYRASANNLDWNFLHRLMEAGRQSATDFAARFRSESA